MKAMCAFFRVARAAYYAWVKRIDQPDPDADRMVLVQEANEASRQTYGCRRIQIWLQQKRGVIINPKAVLRLMNKLGIRSKARKRKVYRKLEDSQDHQRYPNIMERDFTASRPHQKWVTDVTYIHTSQGEAYLSTIELVTRTLPQAQKKEKVTVGIVLHSDQGYQYSAQASHVLPKEYNITPSKSRRSNYWENAPMENFFGHLKEEAIRRVKNPSFQQAKQIIDDYIH